MTNKKNGVLMHISSLPSKFGIGTFGKEAFQFVDFLKEAGQSFWQVLPLGPIDKTGSPYQPSSTFAGNFYFIDFDMLKKEGLLNSDDYELVDWGNDEETLDFSKVMPNKLKILKKAFLNWQKNENCKNELEDFIRKNKWVEIYAAFATLLQKNNNKPFWEWPDKFKYFNMSIVHEIAEKEEDFNFWIFLQIKFFKQWFDLKKYANDKGIKIIGDIPIYVSGNSSDVWENPQNFCLNKDLTPKKISGCPPDAFSKEGQLWGNPVYRWDEMKKTDFYWWQQRLKQQFFLYDVVRLDHFRGFDEYYAIDAKEKTAVNGHWEKGPGLDFFKKMELKLGKLNIVAEDLGFLTDSVKQLLKDTGFAGMKILQHAFDKRESKDPDNLPQNYKENCVLYIGTHDNNTLMGWFFEIDEKSRENCKKQLNFNDYEELNWQFIKAAAKTNCKLVIFTMQDILGLDSKARMNTPGTVGINWKWRMKNNVDLKKIALKLKDFSGRSKFAVT